MGVSRCRPKVSERTIVPHKLSELAMGILEDIANRVLGGGEKGAQSNLINAVVGMLGNQSSGGLAGLVKQFTGEGLGDIVSSWVSTGQNLPVTPEQIRQGLGAGTISQLAQQAGISPEKATSQLSELLPKIVDKLTPDGKIRQENIASSGVDLLKALLQ